MIPQRKRRVLGQEFDVFMAIWANVLSWFVSSFCPSLLTRLIPPCREEGENYGTKCVSIGRPGGLEQLRVVRLKEGIATVGYNIRHFCPAPFTPPIGDESPIPLDCVLLSNEFFSVNYADCTIRWGLYESAKRFVGWPIVPGFDVAGTIEDIRKQSDNVSSTLKNKNNHFFTGDRVFGCTLFGAYSSRVLVPTIQLRKIPDGLTTAQAASLPTVSLTALHALDLAGHYPLPSKYTNKAILIHSAAGGVGSMLVQMSRLLGLSPVVGVVGSSSKVQDAKELGCDVVIDKSCCDLWKEAEAAAPNGFSAIMDANGVSTLNQSYAHLAPTGRLVVFGFHSNLPMGKAMLSPLEWLKMGMKMSKMPKFDAMNLTVDNKSVLGFNLSFFAEEKELVSDLFDQICEWLEENKLRCPRVVTFPIKDIGKAHELIQSGKSVGKIVIDAQT